MVWQVVLEYDAQRIGICQPASEVDVYTPHNECAATRIGPGKKAERLNAVSRVHRVHRPIGPQENGSGRPHHVCQVEQLTFGAGMGVVKSTYQMQGGNAWLR